MAMRGTVEEGVIRTSRWDSQKNFCPPQIGPAFDLILVLLWTGCTTYSRYRLALTMLWSTCAANEQDLRLSLGMNYKYRFKVV